MHSLLIFTDKLNMELILPKPNLAARSVILNIAGFAFIYFMPALSHLTALPLYYLEPMRLMIILGLVHTNRTNTVLLGLSLPAFSFLISSHPAILKASLISIELLANAFLFFWLAGKMKNLFAGAAISIFLSKVLYYSLKGLMIYSGVMDASLIATPLAIQLVVTVLLSLYIWKFMPSVREDRR